MVPYVSKADLREAAAALTAKIDASRFDLLHWIVGLALAQMGLLVGILLKLGGH